MPKGPIDRIIELQQKERELERRIVKGGAEQEGADLKAQLDIVRGELRNLMRANRMFPTMSGAGR